MNAGTPIVLVSDPKGLRIETTDLNEKDIAGVKVGNKVDVAFDALPGVIVEGTVTEIAPKSNKAAGVNYAVTIDLAQVPEKLRWGMTALVGLRQSARRYSADGNVNQKRPPAPISLSMPIYPPMASINSLAIARFRPLPSVSSAD